MKAKIVLAMAAVLATLTTAQAQEVSPSDTRLLVSQQKVSVQMDLTDIEPTSQIAFHNGEIVPNNQYPEGTLCFLLAPNEFGKGMTTIVFSHFAYWRRSSVSAQGSFNTSMLCTNDGRDLTVGDLVRAFGKRGKISIVE